VSTVLDYQNRIVDVVYLQGAEESGIQRLRQVFFAPGNGGQVHAGVEKLAHRYLLEFMTEFGSLPYQPEVGTTFITEVKAGLILSEFDLQASFSINSGRAIANMRREDTGNEDLDEQIETAELISYFLEGDLIELRVKITSLAGRSREVLLPIPVVP
jgi:hypothetical protein